MKVGGVFYTEGVEDSMLDRVKRDFPGVKIYRNKSGSGVAFEKCGHL